MRRRKSRHFTETFKREVIDYYLSHYDSKKEVWKKFIGEDVERGRITRWMCQLGYVKAEVKQVAYLNVMGHKTDQNNSEPKGKLHENELVKELRKQLEEERLKTIAYSKMIDIAEEEFKISIRKKYNTKL